MNYNKHLEELQKFRDAIRDIQNEVEGVAVELGNYVDEVEKMRDDAVRRGAPITFDRNGGMRDKKNSTKDGSHLTNDDIMPGEKLYKEKMKMIEDQMLPFGFREDGESEVLDKDDILQNPNDRWVSVKIDNFS